MQFLFKNSKIKGTCHRTHLSSITKQAVHKTNTDVLENQIEGMQYRKNAVIDKQQQNRMHALQNKRSCSGMKSNTIE